MSTDGSSKDEPRYTQPHLLPAEDIVPDHSPRVPTPARRRGSKLELPIMQFIGHFDVATTYQVLHRFFSLRGKTPVYGYRVLRQLRDAGLLMSERIYPEAGAASLTYLRLTRAGWAAIGERPSAEVLRPLPRPRLEYKLQFAEMMTVRSSEGWREVKASSSFEVLRKWALASYRDRILNDYEIVQRAAIEKMDHGPMKLPVLVDKARSEVRIVLPFREGENPRRSLRALPDMGLFPPVHVEIVCADSELLQEALSLLAKHSEKGGYSVTPSWVPHFNERPNPRNAV